jgi:hypothetical protein
LPLLFGAATPVAAAPAAPSAPPPGPRVSFRLGIVPSATDGATTVRGFSFGLLGDRAVQLDGFQLSFFYAQIDEELLGAQLSAGFNFADGSFRGAQVAGGANFARAGRGLQAAAGFNVAGRLVGAQIACGNDVEDGRGLQIGLINKAVSVDGARAGLANYAGQVRGAEVGLVNGSGEASGVQLGVVNVAGEASGFQLGAVNLARQAHGFQLGVVNLALSSDGESLALVNLVGDGVHELALYTTDTMLSNVAVKLGGRHLYTALVAAYHPGSAAGSGQERLARDSRRIGFGLGAGWRAPVHAGRLEALEVEAGALGLQSTATATTRAAGNWRDRPLLLSLRAGVVVRLVAPLSLLAGLALNAAVAGGGRDADVGLGFAETVTRAGGTTVRIYPGFLIGVQT